MPALLSVGNSQYTQLGTGTVILSTGAVGPQPPSTPGVFYGANLIALGTAPVLNVYDLIYTVSGTGTGTTTNTLMSGTGTAQGQSFNAGLPGVGVRYRGSLMVVSVASAAPLWNLLWD